MSTLWWRACCLHWSVTFVLAQRAPGRPVCPEAGLCRQRADYKACVGTPFAPDSVSRAFASEAEGIAYCWGSGLAAELPPRWA